MLRHQVQFVLRFGVYEEFRRLLDELQTAEQKHGWTEQRCWRASSGRMNEMLIEHEYADRAAYDAQREAYHETPDHEFRSALDALAQMMVPGTATEVLLEEQ
jgi:hypothetical protein